MFPFVVTGSSKEANLSLLGFRVSLIQPKLSQSTAFMHTSDSFYFADIYTSAQMRFVLLSHIEILLVFQNPNQISSSYILQWILLWLSEAKSKCIPKHGLSLLAHYIYSGSVLVSNTWSPLVYAIAISLGYKKTDFREPQLQ